MIYVIVDYLFVAFIALSLDIIMYCEIINNNNTLSFNVYYLFNIRKYKGILMKVFQYKLHVHLIKSLPVMIHYNL